MNKIIAVVGMCGSGKTTAISEFEKEGFKRVYFGQATMDILEERGLPRTEDNERAVREELRETGDKGIYAKIYLPKIREYFEAGYNVVIESLYSWSEYKYIKSEFGDAFKVLCIATDAEKRRERLETRAERPLTHEISKSRDYAEIENLEIGGPISIADHYITNNGTEEEFLKKVREFVKNEK